ncbi:MAG: glycosyltransferase family 39 protein [Candidatus Dormiibacterota bacterium]
MDPTEEWRRPPRWRRWEIWGVAAVIAVAGALRFHEFTLAPVLADNQDPLQFGWAGLTLITKHVPYAWEYFSAYHYEVYRYSNGDLYNLTHPWLNHPPLFSLLIGGWAYLLGARELGDVTLSMIRPVAIILGLISMYLAYILGRRVLGSRATMVGLVLLAVSPGAVLLGREVETEALLAPMLLGGLILVHRLHTGEGGRLEVGGVVALCLLMPLVKVSGVVLAGGLAVVLIASGRWRLAAASVLAGAAGFGLFAVYGALFDFNLWLAVLAEWQTHRHGLMAGFEFLSDNAGIGRTFHDGWWLLGLLGLGAIIVRGRTGPRPMLLATTVAVYAAGMTAIGDVLVQGRYAWYRIVLYPILYTVAGYLVWQSVKRPSVPGLLLVLVLGGATAFTAINGKLFTPNPYLLVAVVSLGVLPAAIMLWRSESSGWPRIAQASAAALMLAVVAASIVESWNLAQIYRQI